MTRRTWLALAAAARTLPAAMRDTRLVKFEIHSVRIPFSDRVREAWIKSWTQQKRDQSDYVLQFVKLHTSDGITGICESKMSRPQTEAKLQSMVGKPLETWLAADDLRGLPIAIADVIGKLKGVPVAKLLNPKPATRIIPTWWSQCFPPAVMASEAKLGASLGYRIHKVKARPWEDPIEQAGAICAVVPKDFKIWVDANASWETVERTLDLTNRLAKFPNYFAIESPIARQDIDGYRRLKGKLPLKLAEHIDNIDLDLWTREKLLDAWILGAPKLGRYIETTTAKAKAAKVPIWVEHSIDNGITQVFQAHQAAAYPELQYSIAITHVLQDDCMKEPFTVKNGYYTLPTQPGLGVTLDETALETYRV